MRDEIEKRMRKILELKNRGLAREMDVANIILIKLMQKHNISMDQLDDTNREIRFIKWSPGINNKKLLVQVFDKVLKFDSCNIQMDIGKKWHLGHNMTINEKIEIELLFRIYKKELKKQIDVFYTAFIYKHEIFTPKRADKIIETESQKISNDLEMKMTENIPSVSIRKELE